MKLRTHTMRPAPRRAKPWQRKRALPLRREVMICDAWPDAQIDVYPHTVILTRRKPGGGWTSYPIAAEGLAGALGKLPLASGLLPPRCLAYGVRDGEPFYVCYVPPRALRLPIVEGEREWTAAFQSPPLIWAGWGTDYRLWAVAAIERVSTRDPLFVAPFPNTYPSGSICWGNVPPRQTAGVTTMPETLTLFLEGSQFSAHVVDGKSLAQPASILRRYADLTVEAPYPITDLVSAKVTLGQVVSGAIWGSRSWV